jgi:hypothetical protein
VTSTAGTPRHVNPPASPEHRAQPGVRHARPAVGLSDEDGLIDILHARMRYRDRPLALLLLERGQLTQAQCERIEALIQSPPGPRPAHRPSSELRDSSRRVLVSAGRRRQALPRRSTDSLRGDDFRLRGLRERSGQSRQGEAHFNRQVFPTGRADRALCPGRHSGPEGRTDRARCEVQIALSAYHGCRIGLPSDSALWPNPLHIAWHRKHKFQGA